MGLLTENPVLERELRGRLRLRRKGARRAVPFVAWPIALVALYFYARGLTAVGRGPVQDARDLLPVMTYGALALIVLLAPALASTAITQEREQQTWDALATTRLSAWEILFGKWIGRQIIPWLMIVLALPYLLACAFFGGMGFLILPAVLLFLIVTTAFYSAMGLLCSFQARRTVGATATALTITAALCVGTVIINQVFQLLQTRVGPPENSPVLWLNPFIALSSLLATLDRNGASSFSGSPHEDYGLIVGAYFLVTVAATAAALYFMVSRYHRAVRERA